jgi:hypothetical protein
MLYVITYLIIGICFAIGYYIYLSIDRADVDVEEVLTGILALVFWPLVILYLIFYGLAKFLRIIIDG